MVRYFGKGEKILLDKGYRRNDEDGARFIRFQRKYNGDLQLEIWFDLTEDEFTGFVWCRSQSIDKQEQIDEIQLAYNNLQADLKELKEIKND